MKARQLTISYVRCITQHDYTWDRFFMWAAPDGDQNAQEVLNKINGKWITFRSKSKGIYPNPPIKIYFDNTVKVSIKLMHTGSLDTIGEFLIDSTAFDQTRKISIPCSGGAVYEIEYKVDVVIDPSIQRRLPSFWNPRATPAGNFAADKAGQKWILSIDGGGVRGIIPLMGILAVEQYYRKPAREIFDMVAGTSTGSIIAAGIANGMEVVDMIKLYDDIAIRSALFTPNSVATKKSFNAIQIDGRPIGEIRNDLTAKLANAVSDSAITSVLSALSKLLMVPKYKTDTKKTVLDRIFGNKTLRACPMDIFITSKDMFRAETMFFSSFHNASNTFGTFKDLKLSAAVLASTAAPTYFDPVQSMIDGGVGAYNNPSFVAAIEALYYSKPNPNTPASNIGSKYQEGKVGVWSFGTGTTTQFYSSSELANSIHGPLEKRKNMMPFWLNYLVEDSFYSANSQQTYLCSTLLDGMLKKIKYRRFNVFLDPKLLESYNIPSAATQIKEIGLDSVYGPYEVCREIGIRLAESIWLSRTSSMQQGLEVNRPVTDPAYLSGLVSILNR